MEIFRAENVVKDFARQRALDHVSIRVEAGRIFGLLGPNGAGKTTLIRIINQITAPDEGELFFENRRLKSSDVEMIGYLPEERGLYKKMKVGEQALYLARLKGMNRIDALKKLKYWFEKFEIQAWWDKKVEELSKGMQQKVQFVTTILHQPKLLIFDEPFSGFDPINTDLMKNEILFLRDQGASIIFSTHDMESVEEICDDIALINSSKKIIDGTVHNIRNMYKSDTFDLSFRGDETAMKQSLNGDYVIESSQTINQVTSVRLKLSGEHSANEFLSRILPVVQVVSFTEVTPRMRNIFIRLVKETGNSMQN